MLVFLGRMSKDPANPDFTPSVFSFRRTKNKLLKSKLERFKRVQRRRNLQNESQLVEMDKTKQDVASSSLEIDIPDEDFNSKGIIMIITIKIIHFRENFETQGIVIFKTSLLDNKTIVNYPPSRI